MDNINDLLLIGGCSFIFVCVFAFYTVFIDFFISGGVSNNELSSPIDILVYKAMAGLGAIFTISIVVGFIIL